MLRSGAELAAVTAGGETEEGRLDAMENYLKANANETYGGEVVNEVFLTRMRRRRCCCRQRCRW